MAHCRLPIVWFCRGPFISPLHFYLIHTSGPFTESVFEPFSMPGIHTEHAPYFLHKKAFTVLRLYSSYCWWICPVRSPIDNHHCICLAYPRARHNCWLVFPKRSWLVSYLSHIFHSACFLRSVQDQLRIGFYTSVSSLHELFHQPIQGSSLLQAKTFSAWR